MTRDLPTSRASPRSGPGWLERYPVDTTRTPPPLPPTIAFHNPVGVTTGEYGDANCADERFWAGAELLRTTRAGKYERFFVRNYQNFLDAVRPPSWNSVGAMGLWTYSRGGPDRITLGVANRGIPEVAESIRRATHAVASEVVERALSNPYRVHAAERFRLGLERSGG